MGSMTWRYLLEEEEKYRVLPWYGRKRVYSNGRSWVIRGGLPLEHGWHEFQCESNKNCRWVRKADMPPEYLVKEVPWGYLVGSRFIMPDARAEADPNKLVEQTERVHLAPDYLDWLSSCRVLRDGGGDLVYLRNELLPIAAVDAIGAIIAGHDLKDVKGVSPALELAFNWRARELEIQEERRRRIRERREAREKQTNFTRSWKGARERRELTEEDFDAAASGALLVSGARLLGTRNSPNQGEKVVQYRIRDRNFECVVDRQTLQIIDAGVCLTDERTGEKGDHLLTLESLPGVVCEAIDAGVLVVWRHV